MMDWLLRMIAFVAVTWAAVALVTIEVVRSMP